MEGMKSMEMVLMNSSTLLDEIFNAQRQRTTLTRTPTTKNLMDVKNLSLSPSLVSSRKKNLFLKNHEISQNFTKFTEI